MSAPTNHWKLGAFVVTSFALFVATLIFLGARSFQKETIEYKTYLDEAVTGLELGSPVKYRGVTVGNVSNVEVAPDRRHVAVTMTFPVQAMSHLGLTHKDGRKTLISLPPDMRIQMGSTGLTGVKYLQMDFFDVALYPPQPLPFPVPENTIPAAPSAMKNLEDSIITSVQKLPEVMGRLVSVMERADRMMASVEEGKLPERTAVLLSELDITVRAARGALQGIDSSKLSKRAQTTLDKVDTTVQSFNDILVTAQGDKGIMTSATRASTAIGVVAQNAGGVGRELEDTLREVRDAAQSIQRLSDALEREPDMLIKGRTKAATK